MDNPKIDVVYIALPHGHHFTWLKKAILKGKAVLCEKPAMMNAQEMQEIKQLSKEHNVFFMEALKTRFIPLYKELKQMLQDNVIGTINKVEVSFCSLVAYTKDSYIYDSYQGGCLLDTGIYGVGYIDEYIKGDYYIESVESNIHECGVNTYIKAIIKFGDITGVVECALDRKKPRLSVITGTKGKIVIEEFHRPTIAQVKVDGKDVYTVERIYEYDDFYSQIHHVTQCLLQNKSESNSMSLDDSLLCVNILDAIKEAI